MLKYKLILTGEATRLLDGTHPAIYHHRVLSRIAKEGQTFHEGGVSTLSFYGEGIPPFEERLRELRETFPWPNIVLRRSQTIGDLAGTVEDRVRVYDVILHPPKSSEQRYPPVEPEDQDLFGVLIGRLVSERDN